MLTRVAAWADAGTLLVGALVAALLLLIPLGLVLLADRRATLRRLEQHRDLVSRYTKLASDNGPPEYRVLEWDELVTIEPNGDARRRLAMRAEVLVGDLWAVRLLHGCGWPQPAKHRDRVVVEARKLLAGDVPGPRMVSTSAWLEDGKFVLIVHFSTPLPEGSKFGVLAECRWPGMCVPLMRERTPDEFTFKFRTPVLRARSRVVLPPGVDAYAEPVGFGEDDEGIALGRSVDGSRRTVFSVEAIFLPLRKDVGMRLEVRRRGAR